MVAIDIIEAIENGDINTLENIENSRLFETDSDDLGANCLHYAARQGGVEVVKYFVQKRGFQGNKRSNIGATPAHDAATVGNLPALQWLIGNSGCGVNDQDGTGATVLHLACRFHQTHITEWLLNEGEADMGIKTASGGIPLHFAVVGDDVEAVKLLLTEDAMMVNLQTASGATAVYLASQEGNLEILRYLVNTQRGNVKMKAYDGMSCLHAAAQSGHLDCVKFLLEQEQMNPNERDFDGATALHYAASQDHFHVINWLMIQGQAKVTLDNIGGSPLHNAAESGHIQCIKALLENGCSPDITDNNGLTAAELARKCFQEKAASYIDNCKSQPDFDTIDLLEVKSHVHVHPPPLSDEGSGVFMEAPSHARPGSPELALPHTQDTHGDSIEAHGNTQETGELESVASHITTQADSSDYHNGGLSSDFSIDKQMGSHSNMSSSVSSLSSLSHLEDAITAAADTQSHDLSHNSPANRKFGSPERQKSPVNRKLEKQEGVLNKLGTTIKPSQTRGSRSFIESRQINFAQPSKSNPGYGQVSNAKNSRVNWNGSKIKSVKFQSDEKEIITVDVHAEKEFDFRVTDKLEEADDTYTELLDVMDGHSPNEETVNANSRLSPVRGLHNGSDTKRESVFSIVNRTDSKTSTDLSIGGETHTKITIKSTHHEHTGDTNEEKDTVLKDIHTAHTPMLVSTPIAPNGVPEPPPPPLPSVPPPPPPPQTGLVLKIPEPTYQPSNSQSSTETANSEPKSERSTALFTEESLAAKRSTLTPTVPNSSAPSTTSPNVDLIAELKAAMGSASSSLKRTARPSDMTQQPTMVFSAGQKSNGTVEKSPKKGESGKQELVGEWDPKNFIDQVPNKDNLPAWKVQVLARQMAEKSMKKMTEKRQIENREMRFKNMPPWKRALMKKKETEMNAAQEQKLQQQQQQKQPNKRVPHVAIGTEDRGEGERMSR